VENICAYYMNYEDVGNVKYTPAAAIPWSRAAQCDYIYRGLPVRVLLFNAYQHNRRSGHPWKAMLRASMPHRLVDNSCPPFKTQKELGGRAIVSDSFSKTEEIPPGMWGPQYETRVAGDAVYAHTQGHHVLYGDWSARWVGDPKQSITWRDTQWSADDQGQRDNGHPNLYNTTLTDTYDYNAGPKTYSMIGTWDSPIYGWTDPFSPPDTIYTAMVHTRYRERASHSVFHQFDVSNQIDVVPDGLHYPIWLP